MAPSSSRRRSMEIPTESSWRMVEGEHDSFDTSIVPDEGDIIFSSQSQYSAGSLESQGNLSSFPNSQDDHLQAFLSRAEDEQVILQSPFRPSVPNSVRHSSSTSRENFHKHRSPEPEFIMPTVEVESSFSGTSPRRGKGKPSSSATVTGRRVAERAFIRQRQPLRGAAGAGAVHQGPGHLGFGGQDSEPDLGRRLARSFPGVASDLAAWLFGMLGLSFRYAQKPLAVLLAIYLFFGGLIIAQNMVTRSIYTSMSPLCRIPGVSLLHLPFCPEVIPGDARDQAGARDGRAGKRSQGGKPVEFTGLMNVQEQFEEVLEKGAQGVSLPMEMKRSETSIRDLRTMVRYSTLQSKEELVLEFDYFIDTARRASNDLQRFNTHVGSAVDSVISVNRWTSRYIDSLVVERESRGWITDFTSWIFSPFQPAVFSEKVLLDKYVEHTALVSDKIADLILEAQGVLRTLSKAEDHLGIIYDFVTRTERTVQARKDDVLWTLWTLVGANSRHLHNLNSQLSLLRAVDVQRNTAVRQVSELIVELEKIQAGLGDLRDRVAEPEIARASGRGDSIPLSVHIETINRGVERLERARARIRAIEDDKIRQVLSVESGPAGEDRMIEST